MKVLVCLMGKSGSGKDYMSTRLMSRGFLKMVSSTTRNPREGEINGKDYYFFSMEEFNEKEKQGLFAEVVEYNGQKYGFLKSELDKIKESNCLAIVTPSGFEQLSHMLKDYMVIPVFLDTKDDERKEKLLQRHKNESNFEFYKKQIEERMEQDRKTFARVLNIKNIHVYHVDYTSETADEIIYDIMETVQSFEEREGRILILDFDDVIVPTLDKAVDIYNKENKKRIKTDMFKEWNCENIVKGFIEYFEKVDFENISDKNDSIKWVRELNKHYDVVIATASTSNSFSRKESWIRKNMPFIPWKNIMCVRNKDLLEGYAIVDDATHNLVNNKTKRKFLYNAPHNQEYTGSALRIHSLEDVYNVLVKNDLGWE